MQPAIARAMFQLLEPIATVAYFAPELQDVCERLGLTAHRMSYYAPRAAALGPVAAEVVAACFFHHPMALVRPAIPRAWHARFAACGIRTRRSRYEGPTGIATIVMDAAQRRGMASCNVRGPAPHYLGNATNPAVSRALLIAVASLLDLDLDVAPFEAAVRAFRSQCDQAVAQDEAVQAYVRQLEQAYDAPGAEAPPPQRDEDVNSEQLMHELEDFLRQEREGRGD